MLRTFLAAVFIYGLAGCAAEVIDEPEVEVDGLAEALTGTVNLRITGFGRQTLPFSGMTVTLEAGGNGVPTNARIQYQTPRYGYLLRSATQSVACRGSDGITRSVTRSFSGHALPTGASAEPAVSCPSPAQLLSSVASVTLSSP
jgi:hypothetical protein